jgi:hypothetical protein
MDVASVVPTVSHMAGIPVVGQVVGVCDAILRYLAMHPDAADSAIGIRQWWLQDQDVNPTPEELQDALNRLVADGLIRRDERIGGVDIYSARVATQ